MPKRLLFTVSAAALLLGACAHAPQSKAGADSSAAAPIAAKAPAADKQPVQVGTGVIVAATPAQIWGILADLDQWGAWNTKVTKVSAAPGLNVGTAIAYSWEERELKATVETLKENSELSWRGARTGGDVVLKWMLVPVPAGTSLNLFAVLKPGAGETPKANALVEISAWLEALKAEAEKRFPAPAPKAKAPKKAAKAPVSKP